MDREYTKKTYQAYQNFYIKPLEQEAQIEAYMAELYFQKDSFNLALNGDGQYVGFLDIANDYGSTKIGNLANYYAGLCYLHTGEYESAIDYLEDFSSNDIILSSNPLIIIWNTKVQNVQGITVFQNEKIIYTAALDGG